VGSFHLERLMKTFSRSEKPEGTERTG
jgi:hypothetical protein